MSVTDIVSQLYNHAIMEKLELSIGKILYDRKTVSVLLSAPREMEQYTIKF
jgi:hypothetical protein